VGEIRAAPEPSALVVGSPRGAEALADALEATGRQAIRTLPAVAVGGTTASRLASLGSAHPLAAEKADVEGVLERLAQALRAKR
jgi:uroporphyrinogen-III synthase